MFGCLQLTLDEMETGVPEAGIGEINVNNLQPYKGKHEGRPAELQVAWDELLAALLVSSADRPTGASS